jgi:23S rRNA pseudouridine1911/1915/1917 synthase
MRVDTFLSCHLRNYNPWRLHRLVQAGCVWIDHNTAEMTQRVRVGQTVRVRLVEPPDKLLKAMPEPISVVYEDQWITVVDKPAGLIAHPTGEHQGRTLANVLQAHLDRRSSIRGLLRPGIVHRLDRYTSGLMVTANTHLAHRNLATSFETSRVSKTYMALVEGVMPKDADTIRLPIGRANLKRCVLMSARGDAQDPRPATTNYRVCERFAAHTLVECRPLTGRNHQIRVHLSQIGFPLVGDEFYEAFGKLKPIRLEAVPDDDEADELESEGLETGLPIRRHALHAAKLSFNHPVTDHWLTFTAPLPGDFKQTLDYLRASVTA